jgi:hypothetical protein
MNSYSNNDKRLFRCQTSQDIISNYETAKSLS